MKAVIIGGFVDYQVQMSRHLKGDNDSLVYVYTKDTALPPENARIADGIKVRLLSRPGAIYNPIVLAKFLKSSYRMLREIKEYGPDIVHLQIGSSMLGFYIPFLRRYPIITTFHDLRPHDGEAKFWEKYMHAYIRHASKYLMVHGDRLREAMIRDFGQPPSKVKSIPIGPHNIDAFRMYEREGIKEDKNMVLFFGRILDYKGLEYLIMAEPYIRREAPDARIVIAGSGDFRRYEGLMANRGSFEVINRYISYREGAALFQRASVVVLPYVEASQSGVVPTAYGFKKPVVATSVGSIPEVVDDGATGFIVPPKDPVSLANAIVRLLKDEGLRRRMGENGHRKLSAELSWDCVIGKTLEVYRSACNGLKSEK